VSSVSQIPLWGQAYELVVRYADKPPVTITSNSWEPDALRITFEVLRSTLPSPWWYADIDIYNLQLAEIQEILVNATWCTLKAGFQNGPNLYSIIWDGHVLQVLYDREAVVDQRVTLHCVANPLVMDDIVSFGMGPYSSQLHLVQRMAQTINLPAMSVGDGTLSQQANDALAAKQYPRGRGVFGKVGKYLTQIADDNFMANWRDGYKAYISQVSNNSATPDLIYCPQFSPSSPNSNIPAGWTASIIGTPRQTPFGVIFEVLLDPRLKVQLPPLVVQLQRTLIQQLSVFPGQTVATPLTVDLTFFVSQVRHRGDSRGNDWQTEVTGYSTTYADNLLNGIFSANSGG